jgi:hypothetical protein
MRVVQITLKSGNNAYNTKLGYPRQIVPNSFKTGHLIPAPQYTLELVVDPVIDPTTPPSPCTFSVVGLNQDGTGSFLGQAGNVFLFSDCFGSV